MMNGFVNIHQHGSYGFNSLFGGESNNANDGKFDGFHPKNSAWFGLVSYNDPCLMGGLFLGRAQQQKENVEIRIE